jgi:hypothetical protein
MTKNTTEQNEQTRARTPRKRVYEKPRETALAQGLIDHFKKDNYDLKLVRWLINGDEDYRYLHRRENEGYEYVREAEIPKEYLSGMRVNSNRVIMGDLCLMKIDSDLRNSRRQAYQNDTDQEVMSVDVHVLEKKGFRNTGSRSKVILREPTFQE